MWYLAIFVLALAGIAALPWWLDWRCTRIGPKERQKAKGDFAVLSQGVTCYSWLGPARGPVAVLIHGIATPSICMVDLAKGLGRLGYRVLVYDLYGRGLSDAPRGRQDGAFFLRQLSDLLDHQNVPEDVTLAGYGMGGAIATLFTAHNPHRVTRLMLFASAGIRGSEDRFNRFCRRTPVIGDWVHGIWARRRLLAAIPTDGPDLTLNILQAAQRADLNRRGHLRAILSSRRGILSERLEQEHRKIAGLALPVVAIWAEKDEVIALSALGQLARWNRDARQEVVPRAGHAMPYSQPTETIKALRIALRG
ncbi:alpha/beta fold hydrolase [Yoonia sp.]|uniref:alpha/beta fold hydrolase n=1 Tax=Yoonia sp. TaxID=2212373 RepID=UPI0040473021